jgi:HEPN domain-containing protein
MNEEITRWIAFANEDLRVAELIIEDEIFNQVCFHAQQSIEKTLKAAILAQGKTPRRTHIIVDLLNDLAAPWLTDIGDELKEMDLYYIPTRYPDTLPGMLPDGPPNLADARSALLLARQLYDRAVAELSKPEPPNDETNDK